MKTFDRVHHEILIHSQRNSRWSYNNPPLAQLPRDLTTIYKPDPGWPWFLFDWDQIELRLVACYSKDATLLNCFSKGWDVHALAAYAMFGLPHPSNLCDPVHATENAAWRTQVAWKPCDHPSDICGKDDPRRHFAKTFGHRQSYGGTAKRAGDIPGAKMLGLTPTVLSRMARERAALFPGLATWQDRLVEDATRTGETRTWAGRRRRYLDRGKGNYLRGEILDHPMQAGVQDIANEVFLEIVDTFGSDVIYKYGKHDSMIWGIRESAYDDICSGIRAIVTRSRMINGVEMAFPASFKERRA